MGNFNSRTLSGLNECKLVALDLWSKSVGLFSRCPGKEPLHRAHGSPARGCCRQMTSYSQLSQFRLSHVDAIADIAQKCPERFHASRRRLHYILRTRDLGMLVLFCFWPAKLTSIHLIIPFPRTVPKLISRFAQALTVNSMK
jgi:hypothetical protein